MLPSILAVLVFSGSVRGEALVTDPPEPSALNALSDAVQALARRVQPCVVKVVAVGYLGKEDGRVDEGAVSRGQNSGSGVIIDPAGYIVATTIP